MNVSPQGLEGIMLAMEPSDLYETCASAPNIRAICMNNPILNQRYQRELQRRRRLHQRGEQ